LDTCRFILAVFAPGLAIRIGIGIVAQFGGSLSLASESAEQLDLHAAETSEKARARLRFHHAAWASC
jgi:hypothetical protein